MVVDGAPLINETNSLRGEKLKDKIRVAYIMSQRCSRYP